MFENRWGAAESAYARAMQTDSTFWLANWRYWESQNWGGPRPATADPPVRKTFLEHRDALPARDRLYIEADYATLLHPEKPVSLADWLHAKAAVVRQYPDYWWGQFDYADNLLHSGPLVGYSAEDAQRALERATVLMPRFAPAWEHLVIASLGRDTAAAGRGLTALERLGASRPEGGAQTPYSWFTMWRALDKAQRRGGALEPAVSDTFARLLAPVRDPDPHQYYAVHTLWFGFPQAVIDISGRVLRMGVPPEVARMHRKGIAMAWAARGAWDSALTVMETVSSWEAYRLAVIGAWLGGVASDSALTRRRGVPGHGQELAEADSAELFWLDGLLAAARRDRVGLTDALRALRGIRDSSGDLLEPTLAAHELSLRGREPTVGEALASFEEKVGGAVHRYPYLRSVNRLAASQWLLASGDTVRAASLLLWHEAEITSREPQQVAGMLAGLAYLELGRIDAARGRPELGRRHLEQFLRRYDLPVPAHRHLVKEARAALAQLEGQWKGEPGRAP